MAAAEDRLVGNGNVIESCYCHVTPEVLAALALPPHSASNAGIRLTAARLYLRPVSLDALNAHQ
jgi:hypothetical protein